MYALQNAIRYEGKANPGSVIGQILREHPDVKSRMHELQGAARDAVERVNKLPLDEQRAELETTAPHLLERKEHVQRSPFESLGLTKDGRYITAFPPEPSKYPHLGHAKAALVNYELAVWSGGSFLLRFDDTNPELARDEFYSIIEDNLGWLGIAWSRKDVASEPVNMNRLLAIAEELIEHGYCFVDDTDAETTKKERYAGEPSRNRDQPLAETKQRWNDLRDGEVLRLKIDPAHQNSTMRDPTIFRVITTPHVRAGRAYTKWPTYDFETCLMDSIQGVTFRIRSKEFELRTELHHYIQRIAGFPLTQYYEQARFEIEGVETSGRVIREKIQSGEYLGWDDPRLATIVALRRRGFTPEALRSFLLAMGITKNDAVLTWDDLFLHNRRVLNDRAKRLFFIEDPVRLTIANAPAKRVALSFFPHEKKPDRLFETTESFLIARTDAESLRPGELYRLMDCVNFTRDGEDFAYVDDTLETYRSRGSRILH
jgi:glutamyl-tRNA synthetase